MIVPAPLKLHSTPGTDDTFIPAVLQKSIWKNIVRTTDDKAELVVHYIVLKQ